MQGRVRTKTVKKAARVLVEKYYTRLTHDFQTNKKIAEDVAIIPSKRLRNKIAGFATVRNFWYLLDMRVHLQTHFSSLCRPPCAICKLLILVCVQHLMKRISRGPVRGISLKLQEEERERRMDVVPDRSALDADSIDVDPETKEMLKALNVNLPHVQIVQLAGASSYERRDGPRPPRRTP